MTVRRRALPGGWRRHGHHAQSAFASEPKQNARITFGSHSSMTETNGGVLLIAMLDDGGTFFARHLRFTSALQVIDDRRLIGMFAELPDELAILCVDGSLSCAVKLGSTNKLLKQKLQSANIPLRVLATNILTAVLAETTTGFHVGELVWARTALRSNEIHALAGNLPKLHTIWINPFPIWTGSTYEWGPGYVSHLWAVYMTQYGVQALFALWTRVQVKPRARVTME